MSATSLEPDISWTLIGTGNDPNTGDIYQRLDRFGRVDNCLWQKGTTTLAQIPYGYDRASNRKWRDDGALTGYDELYSWDGLYRLTDQKRGTLTGTAITSGTFEQQWGLDATGNWNTLTETTGTTQQQLSARYDVWNRLVLITNGKQKISEHVYDARGYRIRKDSSTSGTLTKARHCYYTPGWQCVEECIGASTTAERQLVASIGFSRRPKPLTAVLKLASGSWSSVLSSPCSDWR